jgi:hypothetical protein
MQQGPEQHQSQVLLLQHTEAPVPSNPLPPSCSNTLDRVRVSLGRSRSAQAPSPAIPPDTDPGLPDFSPPAGLTERSETEGAGGSPSPPRVMRAGRTGQRRTMSGSYWSVASESGAARLVWNRASRVRIVQAERGPAWYGSVQPRASARVQPSWPQRYCVSYPRLTSAGTATRLWTDAIRGCGSG